MADIGYVAKRVGREVERLLVQALEQSPTSFGTLQLRCSVESGQHSANSEPLARGEVTFDVGDLLAATDRRTPPSSRLLGDFALPTPADSPFEGALPRSYPTASSVRTLTVSAVSPGRKRKAASSRLQQSTSVRRKTTSHTPDLHDDDGQIVPQRPRALPDNPILQPPSLSKFINGVWESLFSGTKLDPVEVIEQWQAIESSGQPKLIVDSHDQVVSRGTSIADGDFSKMSVLARKISQTSRTCRSLEVVVQCRWMQLFDEQVATLAATSTKEKAKKATIAAACLDFKWSEKELRNKTAIWRGYADIQKTGGWAALVFAGMGLYRFCKYRVAFTEETFEVLRSLRHRFEVAADTMHTNWRQLLTIVNGPTTRRYTGHMHSHVVCGPHDETIDLPITYHQWDKDFSYQHLNESCIDEEAWGNYDPRVIQLEGPFTCEACKEVQSDVPTASSCTCFPALYPPVLAGPSPVQVYRTPNGRNNGLLACLPFEEGAAIGEFVGLITAGVSGKDVMWGETARASYQIWQGRQGNHTRFVNHSCEPNSQFERFVWMGTQRIILVSKGVDAGEEVTVDYTDTYWRNLDKECLCGQPTCRYKDRSRITATAQG
ncbi:hypothetical protein B0A48_11437 [Cryoendolithus antarcticus]|uniref:SET domain-containing protein n=1 Tax=Cryoendolithus antarcticus TaxID=1507870 RepID=A0A1V8SWC9_9PEZI|nr:hypothetical protein B0A48_11437 [Cryoendolithus antarcticus]